MPHYTTNKLPDNAEKFLKEYSSTRKAVTVSQYRASLSNFFRFLIIKKLDLSSLNPEHIKEFDLDLKLHNIGLSTRRDRIHHVRTFIIWLENKGDLEHGYGKKVFPNFSAETVCPSQSPLPVLAEDFINVLSATYKPSTVSGYKSMLRGFYLFHNKTKRAAYSIDRKDVEAYMIHLFKMKMMPEHRKQRLLALRRYLDWLFEHKKLKTHPDELVSPKDFPKGEERLPRPFSVEVDLEIQKRLEKEGSLDYLGVLLLRRCGLRVGELRNLTIDCVGQDLNGNWFLKVPLGKLNNERVIPLDPKTVEIVERIKRHHSMRPEPGTKTIYLISHPTGRRRGIYHFGAILRDITSDLAIPGKVVVHRLRHSFATSLLSAGMSVTSLKELLGHKDIQMTLCYAAVTQETLRKEYFAALSKVQTRYEVTHYPLETPNFRDGIRRSFSDAIKYILKYTKEHGNPNPRKLEIMYGRIRNIRHELSVLLKTDLEEKSSAQ